MLSNLALSIPTEKESYLSQGLGNTELDRMLMHLVAPKLCFDNKALQPSRKSKLRFVWLGRCYVLSKSYYGCTHMRHCT